MSTILSHIDPCSFVAGIAFVLGLLFGLYALIGLVDFAIGARWPSDDEA